MPTYVRECAWVCVSVRARMRTTWWQISSRHVPLASHCAYMHSLRDKDKCVCISKPLLQNLCSCTPTHGPAHKHTQIIATKAESRNGVCVNTHIQTHAHTCEHLQILWNNKIQFHGCAQPCLCVHVAVLCECCSPWHYRINMQFPCNSVFHCGPVSTKYSVSALELCIANAEIFFQYWNLFLCMRPFLGQSNCCMRPFFGQSN